MNKFLKNYLEYREKAEFKDLERFESIYMTEEQQMNYIKDDVLKIEYIEIPFEKVQNYVIEKNPYLIRYINNQKFTTETIQFKIIEKYPSYVKYIKEPTEPVQMEVIKQNFYNIKYINEPTENVQLKIVDEYPYYVKLIKNPTPYVKYLKLKDKKINNLKDDEKEFLNDYIFNILLNKQEYDDLNSELINSNINNIDSLKKYYLYIKDKQYEIRNNFEYNKIDNLIKKIKEIINLS